MYKVWYIGMSFQSHLYKSDLAEEEGGWQSAEEMLKQMQKSDQTSFQNSSMQVILKVVFILP